MIDQIHRCDSPTIPVYPKSLNNFHQRRTIARIKTHESSREKFAPFMGS